MPIYEYRCKDGHTLEVMQRMSDEPLARCTTCGAPVQRVFHPVAVHFKGSGFYNTDYGTKSKNADDAKIKTEEAKSKKTDSDSSAKGKADSSSNSDGAKKPKAAADSKSAS
ncbi:MAG: FmdB family zinc ribbon protein [Thermoleophilaceae bacterium]